MNKSFCGLDTRPSNLFANAGNCALHQQVRPRPAAQPALPGLGPAG